MQHDFSKDIHTGIGNIFKQLNFNQKEMNINGRILNNFRLANIFLINIENKQLQKMFSELKIASETILLRMNFT